MSIGRRYVATLPGIASVSAATQLAVVSCPADAVCMIDHVWIALTSGSGFNESVGVQLIQGGSPGNGTTVSVEPLENGMPAFGGTFIHTITSVANTSDVLIQDAFNAAAGSWHWTPFDESEVIVMSPNSSFAIGTNTAFTSAVTITGGISFREVGG